MDKYIIPDKFKTDDRFKILYEILIHDENYANINNDNIQEVIDLLRIKKIPEKEPEQNEILFKEPIDIAKNNLLNLINILKSNHAVSSNPDMIFPFDVIHEYAYRIFINLIMVFWKYPHDKDSNKIIKLNLGETANTETLSGSLEVVTKFGKFLNVPYSKIYDALYYYQGDEYISYLRENAVISNILNNTNTDNIRNYIILGGEELKVSQISYVAKKDGGKFVNSFIYVGPKNIFKTEYTALIKDRQNEYRRLENLFKTDKSVIVDIAKCIGELYMLKIEIDDQMEKLGKMVSGLTQIDYTENIISGLHKYFEYFLFMFGKEYYFQDYMKFFADARNYFPATIKTLLDYDTNDTDEKIYQNYLSKYTKRNEIMLQTYYNSSPNVTGTLCKQFLDDTSYDTVDTINSLPDNNNIYILKWKQILDECPAANITLVYKKLEKYFYYQKIREYGELMDQISNNIPEYNEQEITALLKKDIKNRDLEINNYCKVETYDKIKISILMLGIYENNNDYMKTLKDKYIAKSIEYNILWYSCKTNTYYNLIKLTNNVELFLELYKNIRVNYESAIKAIRQKQNINKTDAISDSILHQYNLVYPNQYLSYMANEYHIDDIMEKYYKGTEKLYEDHERIYDKMKKQGLDTSKLDKELKKKNEINEQIYNEIIGKIITASYNKKISDINGELISKQILDNYKKILFSYSDTISISLFYTILLNLNLKKKYSEIKLGAGEINGGVDPKTSGKQTGKSSSKWSSKKSSDTGKPSGKWGSKKSSDTGKKSGKMKSQSKPVIISPSDVKSSDVWKDGEWKVRDGRYTFYGTLFGYRLFNVQENKYHGAPLINTLDMLEKNTKEATELKLLYRTTFTNYKKKIDKHNAKYKNYGPQMDIKKLDIAEQKIREINSNSQKLILDIYLSYIFGTNNNIILGFAENILKMPIINEMTFAELCDIINGSDEEKIKKILNSFIDLDTINNSGYINITAGKTSDKLSVSVENNSILNLPVTKHIIYLPKILVTRNTGGLPEKTFTVNNNQVTYTEIHRFFQGMATYTINYMN
jgi:hypothetical protein